MKKRVLYCQKKNLFLLNQKGRVASFDDVIKKIEAGQFIIFEREKNPNIGQKRFLVRVNNYPVIVPFNEKKEVVQLITLFPDRRFK